jgi:hypothetical protein
MESGAEVWLARDDGNGDLYAYTCKPYILKEFGFKEWKSPIMTDFIRLKSELFPEVTFKNSPKKARIILEEDE